MDLGSLPTFRQNASRPQANGFYTGTFVLPAERVNSDLNFNLSYSRLGLEFELGLELDSAEVRGILLYEGQEWGRVVFDFFN